MKKAVITVLSVLFAAFAAAGCSAAFKDDPVTTEPKDEYVKPTFEIEVDGRDNDEFWQGQEEFAFGIDGTARAKMKFLDKGVVFHFSANDTTPNEKGSDVDQADRIEIFMDPLVDGMGDDGLLREDDLQFRMAANGEISIWRGQKCKWEGYIWTHSYIRHAYAAVWDKDGGKYSAELYIPYESMGMSEKPEMIAAAFNQVDIITPMIHWEAEPGERRAQDIGIPNMNYVNFYPVFDSEGRRVTPRPACAPPAIFDGVFEGEDVFRYESAHSEHKAIESVIGDEGVFVRVSLDVTDATLHSWETDGDDYWSAYRTDIRIDMGGEGGNLLDNNDVYVLLRPSNKFVLYRKHGVFHDRFKDVSWTGPTEGWVVYADMNGLAYDTPHQTGRVWMCVYISYDVVGITQKPDSIRVYDAGEGAGTENVPAKWAEMRDGAPTQSPAVINDKTFANAMEFTSTDAKHKKIQAVIGETGVYARVSLDVADANIPAGSEDYWGAYRTDVRIDMGGDGGRLDGNDVYFLILPNGKFVYYRKHETEDRFKDKSWSDRAQIDGCNYAVDLGELELNTDGQTGRIWLSVYVPYSAVGIATKPQSIRIFDAADGSSENLPAEWIIFKEGETPQKQSNFGENTFDGAMTFTSTSNKHKQIQAVIGDKGVYARVSLDVENANIPAVSEDYWGSYRTDIRIDMGGEGGLLDNNDVYFLMLPSGNFVYYRKNPDNYTFKDKSWSDRANVDGCELKVDMNGLKFDTDGQTGRIWLCVYIPYSAVGMTAKPQSIRLFDAAYGSSENLPSEWIIFKEGETPHKEERFGANTFDGAMTFTSTSGRHKQMQAVIGETGVYARVSLDVENANIPAVSEEYWGSYRTDVRIDVGGEGKLLDGNDVYFLMLPSGSFVYYRKNATENSFKDKSWSDANNIDGCELNVDMNGLKFDTEGQTGRIWLCVYIPYTAVGMTAKPQKVRMFDSAKGSTENNPYQWVVFENGKTPAPEQNLTPEKFDGAKKHTSTNAKHPAIEAVIDEHGVYVRVALSVDNANIPSSSTDYWGSYRTDIRIDVGGEGGAEIDNNDVYFLMLPSGSFVYYRKNPDNATFKDKSWSDYNNIDGCELLADMNGLEYNKDGQTGVIRLSVFIPYSAVGMAGKSQKIRVFDCADGSTENNPSAWVEFAA